MIHKPIPLLLFLGLIDVQQCVVDEEVKKLSPTRRIKNDIKTIFADDIKYANLARDMYKSRHYNEAIRLFTKAIRANRSDTKYLIERGNCYLKTKNINDAISDYREAANNTNNLQKSMEYRVFLCEMLFDSNQLEEAEREIRLLDQAELLKMADEKCSTTRAKQAIMLYNAAIEKFPHEKNYRLRGLCWKKLGDLQEALSDFTKGSKLSPEHTDNLTRDLLIESLLELKNFLVVEELIQSLNPNELMKLGDAYRSRKKLKEARYFYSELIAKQPLEKHYRLRGICFKEMGDLNNAIQQFKTAMGLPVEHSDDGTRSLLIEALLDNQNFNEAIQEMSFEDPKELLRLANSYRYQKKLKEALSLSTEAISRYPHQDSYRLRGICRFENGNLNLAIEDFRTAVSFEAEDTSTRNLLIDALFNLKNFEDALKEIDHLSMTDVLKRGEMYCSRSKFKEALHFYDTAIRKNHMSSEFYRLRAICHVKKGALSEAFHDFEEMVKYDHKLCLRNDFGRILFVSALYEHEKRHFAINEMRKLNIVQLWALGEELFLRRSTSNCLSSRAEEVYTAAVKMEPENAECYEKRADFFRNKGHSMASAISDYERATKLDPTRVHSWLSLVEMRLEDRMYTEAKDILQHQQSRFLTMSKENKDRLDKARSQIESKEQEDARKKREEENERQRKRWEKEKRRDEINSQRAFEKGVNFIIFGVPFSTTPRPD